MNMGALIPLITVVFCFVILGLLAWYALSRRLAAEKARYELQLRLLQSAGSPAELNELMKSEGARALLLTRPNESTNPTHRDSRHYAIRAVKGGVVLVFLGGGMLLLAAYFKEDYIVGAVLALAAGLGLLVSAVSSVWLSHRLGKES